MTFEFNSRETYRQFRLTWAKRYHSNNDMVRQIKLKLKQTSRDISKIELSLARDIYGRLKTNREWAQLYMRIIFLYSELADTKRQTDELLEELKLAKKEAHRQWLQTRNT